MQWIVRLSRKLLKREKWEFASHEYSNQLIRFKRSFSVPARKYVHTEIFAFIFKDNICFHFQRYQHLIVSRQVINEKSHGGDLAIDECIASSPDITCMIYVLLTNI